MREIGAGRHDWKWWLNLAGLVWVTGVLVVLAGIGVSAIIWAAMWWTGLK